MNIVSLSSAVGVVVLAVMIILAPSAASFLAIAKPIPRLDPVIRTVLPFSLLRRNQKCGLTTLYVFEHLGIEIKLTLYYSFRSEIFLPILKQQPIRYVYEV